jgi:hypothetical protein
MILIDDDFPATPKFNRWNKAKCIYCPATAFIRVPEEEDNTMYVCPQCTRRPKNTEDGN